VAKTDLRSYSTVAGSNTDIEGISIAEGWPSANINNAIRALMAELKVFFDSGFGQISTEVGNFTLDATDDGTAVTNDNWGFNIVTATATVTLPAASTTTAGWGTIIHNATTASVVTVTRAGADTINALTSIDIGAGETLLVKRSSASAFRAVKFPAAASDGNTFMPLQSAFLAIETDDNLNVTGNGLNYTALFEDPADEIADRNADFTGSTGTYTASQTGLHLLGGVVKMDTLDASATTITIQISTSNRTYTVHSSAGGSMRNSSNNLAINVCHLCDMDKDDTAVLKVQISGMAGDTVEFATNSTFFGWFLG